MTSHTHLDKPDAPICPQFLIGRCDKGPACTKLHMSLPYHWQYRVSLFDDWKSFTDEDNLALEKMYSDVNVETLVNFKPVQPLDLSHLQKQVCIYFIVKQKWPLICVVSCTIATGHHAKFWSFSTTLWNFSRNVSFFELANRELVNRRLLWRRRLLVT